MKDTVKVSAVQLDCAPLDPVRNAERMVEWIERESREFGADLVVFPELASTGYPPVDPPSDFGLRLREASDTVPGPTTRRLGEVAARHGLHVVVGISRLDGGDSARVTNCAAFIGPDGGVIGVHDKVHLPLDEGLFFAAGDKADVFPSKLGRVALNVCYDVRFPELARVQALAGADILVGIWAMYEQPGKAPRDSVVLRTRSRAAENAVYSIGCNRCGDRGGRRFFGRSAIAAPSGELLAETADAAERALRATLSAEQLRAQRAYLSVLEDRRPDVYTRVVE